MERRSDMKRIQNEHIICAGFGFCALNSAVALIPQRSLPREVFGQFVLMAILFAAMAPIAMNDSRPDMQSDSYTWGITLFLLPGVSLVIFLALKVGWWLIALLAAEVGFLSYLMLSRRFRKKRSKKRKRDRR